VTASPSVTAITRREGVNDSERKLRSICDRAFLTPWSYAGVHRRPGQELCDLLVVFGQDVVIFSDKTAGFPESGNLQADWRDWYAEAVEGAASEAWGAERWIRQQPKRLFVDARATQAFPLPVPSPEEATFHRVLVVHGFEERMRRELGGGSIRIDLDVVGPDVPFKVGQVSPQKGFVHVFDDRAVDTLFSELDTVTDVLNYLTWKEQLTQEGRLQSSPSEADLLAYYLDRLAATHEYLPPLPASVGRLVVPEGSWAQYDRSDARQARREANRSSYIVDRLIEKCSGHAYGGTQIDASRPGIAGAANILRFLAGEPRTRRRIIGDAWTRLFESTPSTDFAAVNIVHPSRPGDPYYLLLVVSPDHIEGDFDEYRDSRFWMLRGYCRALCLQFPAAETIIGIATELGVQSGQSEDAIYCDGRYFSEQDAAIARHFVDSRGALQNLKNAVGLEEYFPTRKVRPDRWTWPTVRDRMKGRDRNSSCPCGSGKKRKHCCG
jgi:hypothetical protein